MKFIVEIDKKVFKAIKDRDKFYDNIRDAEPSDIVVELLNYALDNHYAITSWPPIVKPYLSSIKTEEEN